MEDVQRFLSEISECFFFKALNRKAPVKEDLDHVWGKYVKRTKSTPDGMDVETHELESWYVKVLLDTPEITGENHMFTIDHNIKKIYSAIEEYEAMKIFEATRGGDKIDGYTCYKLGDWAMLNNDAGFCYHVNKYGQIEVTFVKYAIILPDEIKGNEFVSYNDDDDDDADAIVAQDVFSPNMVVEPKILLDYIFDRDIINNTSTLAGGSWLFTEDKVREIYEHFGVDYDEPKEQCEAKEMLN